MKKILITLLALALFINSEAQIHKFQAAYLYNICKYMEWPVNYKSGNFVIGVLTNDPIVKELKKIATSKKYLNQKIVVKTFTSTASISKCHVLYIPTKQSGSINAAKSKINNFSTLLVTNKKGAVAQGAGINFLLLRNKLRFEMKKSNITKKKIKVSSAIERLAYKKY